MEQRKRSRVVEVGFVAALMVVAAMVVAGPGAHALHGPTGAGVTAAAHLSATPTAKPNPVDVGQSTTVSAGAAGGSGTYTSYVWAGLPSSCATPGNVASFPCVPTVAGTYVVSVTVTDSAGSHATGKFTLTVDPALNAGTTSASVNPADVGQATTIATSGASGGSGRYTYAWTGLPAGCSSTAASFRCTPTAAGGFTVTLTVTDGNHATAVSSFALTIDAKLVVAASASVNPVDSKTPTTISAAASGGSGTYPSYVWSGALPTGCAFPTGTTTTSFGCTPTHTGSFTIKVAVTDSNKNTVTGSFALKVDASLTVTPTAKPNPVDLGQTTTVSAGATGGSGTYTSYVWSGTAPSGCSLPAGTTTSSFPCSPTSPGSYVLSVTVRDSTGNAVSNSVTLKVDPALVVSPSARPDPADVGQATTISAGASGGSGTYLSYAWSGAVPSGCTLPTGTGTRSFSCTPGSTGTFPITVTVKDSTGNSVTNSVTLTVDPALSPGTVAANPNPLDAGQATTISTTGASGGAGPYTYAWTGLPPGCSTPGSVASFVCTPSVGGTYPVRLTVTDANSATAKATVTLTVSTSLSAGTVSATPSPLDVGQSTTIATTGGSGGAAPYTYAWSGLPPGCPTPGNVSSFACAPTASGMFTVLLVVSDAYANMVGTTLSLVVDSPLGAGTITASPNPADLGQTVYLFASGGSGGTGSGTYAYLWSGLPAGCAAPGNVTSFACAPTASGTSVVQLQVTDGNGAAATTTVSLTVSPAISAELSAAPPVTQVGGSVVLTVTIVGGAPPVTWTLTMNGSSMNLSGVADNAYTFTPPATGTYTFYLNATDASGTPSNTTIVVTVEPALTATLSAAPPETQVGETSVLSLGFTGGVPPVTWTLEEGGSPANLSGVVAGVYDFTPTVPGAFTFYLNASDAVGSASLTTATVVVEPALLVTLSASPATTQVGGISAVTVGVSGGVPPIAWTLFLGATNVTAAASSGTYTFAPGAPGTYTFYLNATDAVGSQSRATASVVVAPALAATLSASPSTTQVGAAATLTAGTSGGVPPIAWTLSVDGAIVANGSANGSYVFVPAVAGTYTFYLNATDAVGSVSNVTATVLVEPALSASLSATPATTDVGVPSVVTLGLSRGVAPYVWTLTMVYIAPTNITGSVVDGSYTFLPTAVGTYWFYLNATDAVGSVANATATVVVEPTLATSLSASPTTTQVGGSSLLTLGISGGAGPVAWTLYLGGANLTSSVLYRTYDFVAGAAGSYTFYLNATDAVGIASSATVTVVVVPALVATLSASPPVTQVGAGCVIALGFTGGVAPIGWTLWIGGTNITADVTGGSYSFLPTAAGTYVFFLNATDAVGSTSGATVIVTVEPALVASLSADRGSIDVGQSLTLTLGGSDGVPPYAWTLEMNGSSANLSGVAGETYRFTPSGPGTYTFYLNVTDRVGSTSSATVVVTVEPALAVGTVSAVPNPLDV
ncbi:MAG TPA: putative Ig domain-containing protein, partial [Thermoplasmata archaeon]|nr:putative Ig domain-containing protein [Thermoplasmata archaeon]